jgi:hypothetical protein
MTTASFPKLHSVGIAGARALARDQLLRVTGYSERGDAPASSQKELGVRRGTQSDGKKQEKSALPRK